MWRRFCQERTSGRARTPTTRSWARFRGLVLGSLIAYIVSQNSDVLIFHYVRRVTAGRHLWLRNNASTTVSQAIDTVLFISIAFGGTVPLATLGTMIVTQYVLKVCIAAIDTPLVYVLVGAIRSAQRREVNAP